MTAAAIESALQCRHSNLEPYQLPQQYKPSNRSAIVVGARTHRQGTGPFVAAGLDANGLAVHGSVATSQESAASARESLSRDWQLSPATYTDLDTAMTELSPTAVAICSPWASHEGLLRQVSAAGHHCLVEKPMAWPATEEAVAKLIASFEQQELYLQVVNQWPTTLPAFARLHGPLPEHIEQFSMRLSPISIGPDMITDSAPHFIGMLQALLGAGDCEQVGIEQGQTESGEDKLRLSCQYRHPTGTCEAVLHLQTQQHRPRPAWYQVNELRADREVELPEYRQYLVFGEQRVAIPDPIHQVAADFANALAQGAKTDGAQLLAAHRNLLQLASAWDG